MGLYFIERQKELSVIKKNLRKGEDFFTASLSAKLCFLCLYLVICGAFLCALLSKNNWVFELNPAMYATGVLLFCVLIAFIIIIYGDCIAITKGKICKWSGFINYEEVNIKDIQNIYLTTKGDNRGIYLVQKNEFVKKIGIGIYTKSQVEKIVQKIEQEIEKNISKEAAEEIEVATVNPTAKEQAKEVGLYALYTILRKVLKFVFLIPFIGIIYLVKEYYADIVIYIYETFEFDIRPYLTARNILLASLAVFFGLYYAFKGIKNLIKKRKEESNNF